MADRHVNTVTHAGPPSELRCATSVRSYYADATSDTHLTCTSTCFGWHRHITHTPRRTGWFMCSQGIKDARTDLDQDLRLCIPPFRAQCCPTARMRLMARSGEPRTISCTSNLCSARKTTASLDAGGERPLRRSGDGHTRRGDQDDGAREREITEFRSTILVG